MHARLDDMLNALLPHSGRALRSGGTPYASTASPRRSYSTSKGTLYLSE